MVLRIIDDIISPYEDNIFSQNKREEKGEEGEKEETTKEVVTVIVKKKTRYYMIKTTHSSKMNKNQELKLKTDQAIKEKRGKRSEYTIY
jgi:hypothetical protein